LVPIAVAGCGRPAGTIFEPIQPPLVWPGPPDPPRIECVGQLTSTRDLQPAVSGWERFRRNLTGEEHGYRLASPKDVAVRGDKVYVADPGVGGVMVLGLADRKWAVIDGKPDHPLAFPTHVAVNQTRLFVSDGKAACVVVFDHNGRYVATWGEGEFTRPAGLCWCPANDRLYVVDVPAHRVVALDDQGEIVGGFGERGTGPGQFNFPLDLAFHEKHGLLLTDTMNARVQRFTLDGTFVSAFGEKGDAAGNLSLPKGLACDSKGHIYVVDGNFENVQIFNATGQLLLDFGREGRKLGEFWLPEGICVDDRDRVWIADTYNRRIQVYQYLSAEGRSQ